MIIEPFYFLFKGGTIFRGQPAEYRGVGLWDRTLGFLLVNPSLYSSWREDDCINIMFSVLTGRFSLHLCPSNCFDAIPLG